MKIKRSVLVVLRGSLAASADRTVRASWVIAAAGNAQFGVDESTGV
jgi:hypothetical protein